MTLAFARGWSGTLPARLLGARGDGNADGDGDGDGDGVDPASDRPAALHDNELLSSVQLQSFSRALVRLRVAKRRKEAAEWFACRPRLTISAWVAILRKRLSPLARPSRFRMCVAGREKGWESLLVMSCSLNRRFLQLTAAVLGPSTSAADLARLRFGLEEAEVSMRKVNEVLV